MPEGVECRIMCDQLQSIVGCKVEGGAAIGTGKFAKNVAIDLMVPWKAVISKINCHGKFIWWELDFSNGMDGYVSNGLGMTGGWNQYKTKHSQLYLKLDNGKEIYFNDVRHFGNFKYLGNNKDILNKCLKKLGPDLLKGFDEVYVARLKRQHGNICEVLMNQKIFAGIGNYIKNESLYRAGINPWSMIKDLDENKCRKLLVEVCAVMQESYTAGGCSVKDFFHMDGNKGSYQDKLLVYGKKMIRENMIQKDQTPDKRSTYWVPAEL